MNNIFEKVKSIDISDVVQHFGLKLNSHGKALCPFHKDKTPSFSINKRNNTWKCFGCEAGGDAIDFVSMLKVISKYEAAKLIVEEFKITDDYVLKKQIEKAKMPMNNNNNNNEIHRRLYRTYK